MQLSFIRAAKLAELADLAEKRGYNYVQVQTKNVLALGADPLNPTHVIDLTKETIRPISGPVIPPDPETPPARISRRASRRSGKYYIEVTLAPSRRGHCWTGVGQRHRYEFWLTTERENQQTEPKAAVNTMTTVRILSQSSALRLSAKSFAVAASIAADRESNHGAC